MAIIVKTREEIAAMREAGRITAMALDAVRHAIRAGITTKELDLIAEEVIRAHDATPAFLHYPNPSYEDAPYPATITVSINEELVHGIPGRRRLANGDVVSIDCGCTYRGFVGDSAFSVGVGTLTPEAHRLLRVTEEALAEAIAASRAGNRLGDVSYAVQRHAEDNGFNVVREYTGHGVGREMHEEPLVPNWGKPHTGLVLRPGMTYAPEPMLMAGSPAVHVKRDLWTVVTRDRSLCAHFEHTIAVTDGEAEILTAL